MKNVNWCKILGHKWIPVFVHGYFGKKEVKFIAAECKRCGFGKDALKKTIYQMDNNLVCSYNEKHYN